MSPRAIRSRSCERPESRKGRDAVQSVVGSGPTLEEAVKDALSRLGAAPDQVVLRKVEEGSAGLLGTAARPYRVRATWRPEFAPPEPVAPEPRVHEPSAFHGEE